MSSATYSPKLFIELGSCIPGGLTAIAKEVDSFKHSMSTAAGLLDGAIASVNSAGRDYNVQKKRELRSSREHYLKTLACSTTFVDRFNKLLRYADIDDTWKNKMVDSAGKGDYRVFSSYVTQIQRFLGQLDSTYQDFVQACANAEAESKGLPMVSSSPIHAPVNDGYISYFWKCLAASSTYACGRRCGNKFIGDERIINSTATTIQYHSYDSVRTTAAKIYSNSLRFQNDLKSMSQDPASSELKEFISAISFISALDQLLAEVKRAYAVVNSCYETLDTGTTVRTVNSY